MSAKESKPNKATPKAAAPPPAAAAAEPVSDTEDGPVTKAFLGESLEKLKKELSEVIDAIKPKTKTRAKEKAEPGEAAGSKPAKPKSATRSITSWINLLISKNDRLCVAMLKGDNTDYWPFGSIRERVEKDTKITNLKVDLNADMSKQKHLETIIRTMGKVLNADEKAYFASLRYAIDNFGKSEHAKKKRGITDVKIPAGLINPDTDAAFDDLLAASASAAEAAAAAEAATKVTHKQHKKSDASDDEKLDDGEDSKSDEEGEFDQ